MPARRFGLLAVFPLVLAVTDSAENASLRRLVERGRHPAIRWGRFPDVQRDMAALYQRNGWMPIWLAERRATREARALVDVLATAADRGLDPEDYDARQLAAFVATMDRRGSDQEQAIRFEVALTVAALRFTRALAQGRISPRESRAPGVPPDRLDAGALVEALRRTPSPDSVLSALEPPWLPYRETKRALGRYRRFAKDSAGRRAFFQARLRQMELALERWRWLPRSEAGRVIYLSAPAGRLQLVEPGGASVWLRAAPIGTRCRSLPAFSGEFWMLTLRPAGSPGATLRITLPDGIELLGGRPAPGGCMELPDGELLAELLLRDRSDWPAERVRQAIAGNRQMFVRLARPVRVLYVYSTGFPDENGQLRFTADELGHDRRLDALLRRGYPYARQ